MALERSPLLPSRLRSGTLVVWASHLGTVEDVAMKLAAFLELMRVAYLEFSEIEELDAWVGWDVFPDGEPEMELEIRFTDWGETLEVRKICLECGQRCHCCTCRDLYAFA